MREDACPELTVKIPPAHASSMAKDVVNHELAPARRRRTRLAIPSRTSHGVHGILIASIEEDLCGRVTGLTPAAISVRFERSSYSVRTPSHGAAWSGGEGRSLGFIRTRGRSSA